MHGGQQYEIYAELNNIMVKRQVALVNVGLSLVFDEFSFKHLITSDNISYSPQGTDAQGENRVRSTKTLLQWK